MVVSTVPKFRAFMPGVLSAIAKLGRVGLAAALEKQTLEPRKVQRRLLSRAVM